MQGIEIADSGTAANLHAIIEATGGDASLLLLAACACVSGQNNAMRASSTSDLTVGDTCCAITPLKDAVEQAQQKTFPCVHTVPCKNCKEALAMEFQDKCIKTLELLVLARTLMGLKPKAA